MKPFNLEEYLKNPSRKVVTRDGRNVTIHCTNYNSTFPIIAEVEGSGYSMAFMDDGGYNCIENSIYDLFFASERREGWINIYLDAVNSSYVGTHIYKSKEEAEESGKKWSGYIATHKIEWENQI